MDDWQFTKNVVQLLNPTYKIYVTIEKEYKDYIRLFIEFFNTQENFRKVASNYNNFKPLPRNELLYVKEPWMPKQWQSRVENVTKLEDAFFFASEIRKLPVGKISTKKRTLMKQHAKTLAEAINIVTSNATSLDEINEPLAYYNSMQPLDGKIKDDFEEVEEGGIPVGKTSPDPFEPDISVGIPAEEQPFLQYGDLFIIIRDTMAVWDNTFNTVISLRDRENAHFDSVPLNFGESGRTHSAVKNALITYNGIADVISHLQYLARETMTNQIHSDEQEILYNTDFVHFFKIIVQMVFYRTKESSPLRKIVAELNTKLKLFAANDTTTTKLNITKFNVRQCQEKMLIIAALMGVNVKSANVEDGELDIKSAEEELGNALLIVMLGASGYYLTGDTLWAGYFAGLYDSVRSLLSILPRTITNITTKLLDWATPLLAHDRNARQRLSRYIKNSRWILDRMAPTAFLARVIYIAGSNYYIEGVDIALTYAMKTLYAVLVDNFVVGLVAYVFSLGVKKFWQAFAPLSRLFDAVEVVRNENLTGPQRLWHWVKGPNWKTTLLDMSLRFIAFIAIKNIEHQMQLMIDPSLNTTQEIYARGASGELRMCAYQPTSGDEADIFKMFFVEVAGGSEWATTTFLRNLVVYAQMELNYFSRAFGANLLEWRGLPATALIARLGMMLTIGRGWLVYFNMLKGFCLARYTLMIREWSVTTHVEESAVNDRKKLYDDIGKIKKPLADLKVSVVEGEEYSKIIHTDEFWNVVMPKVTESVAKELSSDEGNFILKSITKRYERMSNMTVDDVARDFCMRAAETEPLVLRYIYDESETFFKGQVGTSETAIHADLINVIYNMDVKPPAEIVLTKGAHKMTVEDYRAMKKEQQTRETFVPKRLFATFFYGDKEDKEAINERMTLYRSQAGIKVRFKDAHGDIRKTYTQEMNRYYDSLRTGNDPRLIETFKENVHAGRVENALKTVNNLNATTYEYLGALGDLVLIGEMNEAYSNVFNRWLSTIWIGMGGVGTTLTVLKFSKEVWRFVAGAFGFVSSIITSVWPRQQQQEPQGGRRAGRTSGALDVLPASITKQHQLTVTTFKTAKHDLNAFVDQTIDREMIRQLFWLSGMSEWLMHQIYIITKDKQYKEAVLLAGKLFKSPIHINRNIFHFESAADEKYWREVLAQKIEPDQFNAYMNLVIMGLICRKDLLAFASATFKKSSTKTTKLI